MTARAARSTIAPDTPSDRWYEHAVRRAPTLAPGEERTLTGMLDAHRAVVVRDVLGSSHGLAYLGDLANALNARRVDVRSVVELKVDGLVEEARTKCLTHLGRIAELGARRRTARTLAQEFGEEIRGLALRRAHVDAIVARMAAAGKSQAPALARLRVASEVSVRARTRLVESHLRLVTAIARRYGKRGLDLPDLVQEGTIGLMRAIELFDPRREATFATYAAWWIRQAINRALANRARLVRLPGGVEDGLRKLHKHRHYLTRARGRPPTSAEIAAEAQLSRARVDDLRRIEHDIAYPALPFDEPSNDPDGRSFSDVLADETRPGPEAASIARGLESCASRALAMLAPRERQVLELRYGIGWSQGRSFEDIGRKLGVSRQRINQISSKALDKVRRSRHARPLRSFWEA
jgi:RNA polymerase primary sigma factor